MCWLGGLWAGILYGELPAWEGVNLQRWRWVIHVQTGAGGWGDTECDGGKYWTSSPKAWGEILALPHELCYLELFRFLFCKENWWWWWWQLYSDSHKTQSLQFSSTCSKKKGDGKRQGTCVSCPLFAPPEPLSTLIQSASCPGMQNSIRTASMGLLAFRC